MSLNQHFFQLIPPNRCEYLFNFDNTFEIHDDVEILKRMGMSLGLENGTCSPENLNMAKSLVPKSLEAYVTSKCHITLLLNLPFQSFLLSGVFFCHDILSLLLV